MSASQAPLTIGVSTCLLHADPERSTYDGRPLHFSEWSMTRWLIEFGFRAYIIPFIPGDPQMRPVMERMVDGLDGLLIQGGVDVAPASYGETPRRAEWAGDPVRDHYELELFRAAWKRNLPILGVCRGHQLINVALGGTLHQDIQDEVPGALPHRDAERYAHNIHDVRLDPDGLFVRWWETSRGRINSVHHQAIKELGRGLVVEATSPADDVIEGVRWVGDQERWVMGVQWHPEFQSERDPEPLLSTRPILDAFAQACRAERERE